MSDRKGEKSVDAQRGVEEETLKGLEREVEVERQKESSEEEVARLESELKDK